MGAGGGGRESSFKSNCVSGRAVLEDSLTFSYKVKHTFII